MHIPCSMRHPSALTRETTGWQTTFQVLQCVKGSGSATKCLKLLDDKSLDSREGKRVVTVVAAIIVVIHPLTLGHRIWAASI